MWTAQDEKHAEGLAATVVAMTTDEEVRDLDARIAALRSASRPTEPLEVTNEGAPANSRYRTSPSAQGHITSALSQLERRRAALLGR